MGPPILLKHGQQILEALDDRMPTVAAAVVHSCATELGS
jgi:hypothetical protein